MFVGQESVQSSSADQTGLLDSSTDEPRTVLRVVIDNMLYAVSLDMLQQVPVMSFVCLRNDDERSVHTTRVHGHQHERLGLTTF